MQISIYGYKSSSREERLMQRNWRRWPGERSLWDYNRGKYEIILGQTNLGGLKL